MPWSDTLRDHFEHPRNAGAMSAPDRVGRASNPVCGDTLVLYLKLSEGRIEHATFQAQGCPAALAAGSITTVLLTGRSMAEAAQLTDVQVAEALGGLPRAKIHCSVLAQDAVADALASGG